jgi:hypothetical protein
MMKKHALSLAAFAVTLAIFAAAPVTPAFALIGPPGGTIYAHGTAYKTVATPSRLPNHGKFDTLYVLGEGLAPVSDAAPGERAYNGGRWEVRMVTFTGGAEMQYMSADEILAAADRGDLEIGDVVARFVCPLIKK